MIDTPIIHVAYADDHKLVRMGIAGLIHDLGGVHVYIQADNGKDLIDAIKKSKKQPDVCILDINMPVMNGFDTIIELKKKWPDIKVLVLTVFEIELYIIRMIMYGANGYLLKSCSPEDIKKAIEAIHYNGMYYSDTVTRNFFHDVQHKIIKLPNLTEKELLVLKHACSDYSYADIAVRLNTTTRSVEGYRDSLFRKLKTNSRVSLAMFAIQFGLVSVEINSSEDLNLSHKK